MGLPVATFLAAAVCSSPAVSASAAPRTPAGRWTTIDDRTGTPRAVVRISIEHGRLRGVIEHVYRKPEEPEDLRCVRCSGARRGEPIIGMVVLWDHRPEGEGWSGGRLLDPEEGKEYGGRLWLEGPDTLRVRGYWGPFHRTQTWRRLDDEDGPGQEQRVE
jgi:uncharacterized protein (DUF2147 family)